MKHRKMRRTFLKTAVAASVVPYLAFGSNRASAQTPKVDPDSDQAKALQYIHKSSIAENYCANCKLYTGDANSEWGPCAIFPNQSVAAAGWCKAWVAKG